MGKLKSFTIVFFIWVVSKFAHCVEITSCNQPLHLLCSSAVIAAKCGKSQLCLSADWKKNRQLNDITQGENDKVQDMMENLCNDCTRFMKSLGTFMTEDAAFLDKTGKVLKEIYCHKIFVYLSPVCDALVDSYSTELMQSFVEKILPALCIFMGGCDDSPNLNTIKTKSDRSNLWQSVFVSKKKKSVVNNKYEGLCTDCLTYFKDMEAMFRDKSFQAYSITFMESAWFDLTVDYPQFHDYFRNLTSQYLGGFMDFIASIGWTLVCEKYFCELSESSAQNVDKTYDTNTDTQRLLFEPSLIDNVNKISQRPKHYQLSAETEYNPTDLTNE